MIRRASQVLRAVLRRLLTLEVIDRSLVVGAQAFGALIPLLIVFGSVGYKNGSAFADGIIHRFELTGRGAATVRGLLWLVVFVQYWGLTPLLDPLFSGRDALAASVTVSFALW